MQTVLRPQTFTGKLVIQQGRIENKTNLIKGDTLRKLNNLLKAYLFHRAGLRFPFYLAIFSGIKQHITVFLDSDDSRVFARDDHRCRLFGGKYRHTGI
ncbi:hypothetical protein D3C75_869210 [compost metagenome]